MAKKYTLLDINKYFNIYHLIYLIIINYEIFGNLHINI
jgi:hypothetical protein